VQLALTQFGEAQKLLLLSRSSNRAAQ
jgi:hypothetical protein